MIKPVLPLVLLSPPRGQARHYCSVKVVQQGGVLPPARQGRYCGHADLLLGSEVKHVSNEELEKRQTRLFFL